MMQIQNLWKVSCVQQVSSLLFVTIKKIVKNGLKAYKNGTHKQSLEGQVM
jgi:hypothetical protein